MAVNRYNKYTWGKYTPLSYQEMAVLPAYLRQKHDESNKALSEFTLPSDVLEQQHGEEARAIKARYEKQVQDMAEELNQKGFSPMTTNNLLKLNADRTKELDPLTGRLGRLLQSKKVFDTNKAAFYASAPKEMSQQQKDAAWARHIKDYSGYAPGEGDYSTRNIVDVSELGAPSYQDFDKDLAAGNALLGYEATQNPILQGASIISIKGADGLQTYGIRTASGKRLEKTNVPNLDAFLENLKLKWLDRRGEGYAWDEFVQNDHEFRGKLIGNVKGMLQKKEDLRDVNQSISQYTPPAITVPESDGTVVSTGATQNSNLITEKGYKVKTYSDMLNEYKNSKSNYDKLVAANAEAKRKGQATASTQDAYLKFKHWEKVRKNADKLLESNQNYKNAVIEQNDIIKEFKKSLSKEELDVFNSKYKNPSPEDVIDFSKNNLVATRVATGDDVSHMKKSHAIADKLSKTIERRNAIKNKALDESSSTDISNSSMLLPGNDAESFNNFERSKQNILTTLKSANDGGKLAQLLTINNIKDAEGNTITPRNLEDRVIYQTLAASINAEDTKLDRVELSPKSFNKASTVTLHFTGGKSAEKIHRQGVFKGKDLFDNIDVAGKSFSVEVPFDMFLDKTASKSFSTLYGLLDDMHTGKGKVIEAGTDKGKHQGTVLMDDVLIGQLEGRTIGEIRDGLIRYKEYTNGQEHYEIASPKVLSMVELYLTKRYHDSNINDPKYDNVVFDRDFLEQK